MKFHRRIDLNVGWVEFDEDMVRVGDRVVGRLIEVTFPGKEGQPGLTMTIDSSSGVPRCTDLHISAVENGREIRTKDLRAVEVDNWIEAIFAVAADQIISSDENETHSVMNVPNSDSEDAKAARATLRAARRGGRRKVTDDLLRRVAEVYKGEELRPAEAVQLAFGVAPRTSFRYIAEARKRGLL